MTEDTHRSNTDAYTVLKHSPSEPEFYEGERLEIILDSLKYCVENSFGDIAGSTSEKYRRADILLDVVRTSEMAVSPVSEKRVELQRLLRNTKKFDKAMIRDMQKLGIEHKSEKKHHKFSLFNDSRYNWTVSKTSSDKDAWRNALNEACRRVY